MWLVVAGTLVRIILASNFAHHNGLVKRVTIFMTALIRVVDNFVGRPGSFLLLASIAIDLANL